MSDTPRCTALNTKHEAQAAVVLPLLKGASLETLDAITPIIAKQLQEVWDLALTLEREFRAAHLYGDQMKTELEAAQVSALHAQNVCMKMQGEAIDNFRDAARYRWLRLHPTPSRESRGGTQFYPLEAALDEAVDKAMRNG